MKTPKMKTIIDVIEDTAFRANKDWTRITKQVLHPHPAYYRNRETGVEYSWLVGGLSWPVLVSGQGCG